MKAGLAIALALALGALAGHFLLQDNGYVLLSFAGYVVEMSVPIATGLLVLAYLAIRLLAWLWRVPRQLGEATARARVRWAGRQATRGYIAIAEGKLDQGERLLTRGARRSGAPLMNYLAAARLAHQRNDPDRRDGWLRLAYEQEPAATDAVLLAQAEMQMDDQAFDQALATLNRIRGHNPKHAQALKLLAALHWRRQDWHALLDLVPALRAMPPLPPAKLNSWTTDAFEALLADPALDKAGLERLWDEVPKVLRGDPRLVLARANGAARRTAALRVSATGFSDAEAELVGPGKRSRVESVRRGTALFLGLAPATYEVRIRERGRLQATREITIHGPVLTDLEIAAIHGDGGGGGRQ